jgi:Cysteine-rich CPXCG
MEISVQCPYCGESLELSVDESGGGAQTYVEDCQVCCQPMEVRVSVAEDEDDCSVSVRRLDD